MELVLNGTLPLRMPFNPGRRATIAKRERQRQRKREREREREEKE
jgi:hypothetical protein